METVKIRNVIAPNFIKRYYTYTFDTVFTKLSRLKDMTPNGNEEVKAELQEALYHMAAAAKMFVESEKED